MLKLIWVGQWIINGECRILLDENLLKTNFIYKVKHEIKNIQWNIYTKNLLSTEIRLRHWTKQNTSYSVRSFHWNILIRKDKNLWIGLVVWTYYISFCANRESIKTTWRKLKIWLQNILVELIFRALTLWTSTVFVKCIWSLKIRLRNKSVAIEKGLQKWCWKHLIP